MVNIIGELINVRHNNNHAAPTEVECRNAGAVGEGGQAKPASATANAASVDTNVRTVPPAVTKAEKAEERLGILMLREALRTSNIPNPSKWKRTTAFAQAKRAQLAKERRERVRFYAEEGIMTVPQAAQLERCVQTTIRQDCQLLGVRLRASEVKVSPYQGEISARRDMLAKMAPTGITRAAAAEELGVSEATVRRDIKMARIKWEGNR